MNKFFSIAVGEYFYIKPTTPSFATPRFPQAPTPHSLTEGSVLCKKETVLTYINMAETVLGEIGYDPSIDTRIVTQAEIDAAKTAAAPLPPVKKTPVKKAAVKKTVTKKKPVKKAAVKKAMSKNVDTPAKKKVVKKVPVKVVKKTVVKKAVKKVAAKKAPAKKKVR